MRAQVPRDPRPVRPRLQGQHLASTESVHDQNRGEGPNKHLASTESVHGQIRDQGSNTSVFLIP